MVVVAHRISNLGCSLSAMTTDSFIFFIDSNALPVEDIPLRLASGQSGGTYGWPPGMCGQGTLDKLHSKGITKVSQILQLAECMTEPQYKARFGGKPNTWVMRRWLHPRPEIVEEFEGRICRWTKVDCGINLAFLTSLLDTLTEPEKHAPFPWRGTNRRQGEVLQEAIELVQNTFDAL
jgi:hypothetical protein